ncbi:cytochrome b5-related protein-related [Holotrichia oblita]|uniref:Cytochrome b5-related protein-related n=1 Tax=Holotrichia oblita TaxID=644536 RepID=A0ACB9SNW5_HOLOL|nr:cytochrome b5-related protein-related [Holotrichia oblita]
MKSKFLRFLQDNISPQLELPKSSLGFRYPTLRDHPLHTAEIWLRGKQADDGAEGLWRLYDGLYDFSTFIKHHPGGSDWLELTKGTDITEAFEAHHISTIPEKILHLYFVRKAKAPRNSPFTFEENGFYKTLKARVRKELENVPKQPEKRSKILADILFLSFMVTSLITVRDESYIMGSLSGLFLTMTCIAAHNFFHQSDNFRMYYFDFTMMSSRILQAIIEKSALRWENYIPLFHLLFLYQCSGRPFVTTLILYAFIITVGSLIFGYIGLNAGHHHPDLFHDGDEVRSPSKMDWGLHQMDSVRDRLEITGSHFLVLTTFGDHTLHHLFPTIDHGRLNYLYPIFHEVCAHFGMEMKMSTQIDLTVGQFQQLSKIEPTKRSIKG